MSRHFAQLVLLTALLGGGCGETVGFLTVELLVPEITPSIECEADPRRASVMRFLLDCPSEQFEQLFLVDSGRASLSGVPLESCALRVEVENSHGRLLYSGERAVELGEGDVSPVSITLTEEECPRNSSCDGDGDGVADSDEMALGLDPDLADSDEDGLQDGVELAVCCSDPTVYATEQQCELAIQWVSPLVGTPGDGFALGTTAPFTNPTVTLGGQTVPNGPVSYENTTLFFGQVPPNAVLGEVSLRDNTGVVASLGVLFSVLRAAPETILEIDRSVPGVNLPMTVAFDSATYGRDLFLLGATGTDFASMRPSVLRFRYEEGVGRSLERLSLSSASGRTTPIAIDAGGGVVAALLYEEAQPLLHIARTDAALAAETITLPIADALSIVVEGDGRHVLVMRTRGLLRVDTSGGASASMPSATIPNSLGLYCTGADVVRRQKSAREESYAFLACYSCPLEEGATKPPCPQRAALFRFGPLESCFTDERADCWRTFRLPQQEDRTLGGPVVDSPATAQSGEPRLPYVFFLTAESGLFAVPMDAPHDSTPKLLLPLRAGIDPRTRHPLRVDPRRGLLYVLDRVKIERIDLTSQRPLAPAPVGGGQESATSLAMSGDGSALAITRVSPQLPMQLMHICVQRCPLDAGCVCNAMGAPPP